MLQEVGRIKGLGFNRCTLGICVAGAMLAGCGGGSTPLSPSPAGAAPEQTHVRPAYSVLYSFKGGNYGRDPHAGPLINVTSTLYGTTVYGGGPCYERCFGGTVFAIRTSGGGAVLHTFEGGSKDGKNPRAGLIDVDGIALRHHRSRWSCVLLLRNRVQGHTLRRGNRALQLRR